MAIDLGIQCHFLQSMAADKSPDSQSRHQSDTNIWCATNYLNKVFVGSKILVWMIFGIVFCKLETSYASVDFTEVKMSFWNSFTANNFGDIAAFILRTEVFSSLNFNEA